MADKATPEKKKSTVKKAPARKAPKKKAALKKKAAPKSKVTPKHKVAPKKKAASRKVAPGKKAAAGKAAARKAAPKKVSPKKASPKNASPKKQAAAKSSPTPRKTAGPQPLMNALRAEHRHIAKVMQLLAEQLEAIDGGELVDTHVVYEIMDYMVTWPDRFHHPREDLIYARVAEVDGSVGDEVDTLQRDHDHTAKNGKRVLQDIHRWRQGELSGAAVVKSGRDYIDHIHEHMTLEEKVVFPHIESILTIEDWRELAEDDHLRAVGDSILGPQIQREFRNMTRKLRRSMRRGVERGAMVEWIGVEALMESLEVVSIAYESARDSTGDQLRGALKDSMEMLRDDFLSAPLKIVSNNARVTFKILGEVAEISRETAGDLGRVNQERLDRVRLLSRNSSQG